MDILCKIKNESYYGDIWLILRQCEWYDLLWIDNW